MQFNANHILMSQLHWYQNFPLFGIFSNFICSLHFHCLAWKPWPSVRREWISRCDVVLFSTLRTILKSFIYLFFWLNEFKLVCVRQCAMLISNKWFVREFVVDGFGAPYFFLFSCTIHCSARAHVRPGNRRKCCLIGLFTIQYHKTLTIFFYMF